MSEASGELTAWGRWVKAQPPGTLSRAMRATGFAWTTVSKAQFRLVTLETAEALAKFTRGEVKARELVKRRSAA